MTASHSNGVQYFGFRLVEGDYFGYACGWLIQITMRNLLGFCFRTYTLKGESDEELESWHLAIKNKQVQDFENLNTLGIPSGSEYCVQISDIFSVVVSK